MINYKFESHKTYLVKFKPKNISGILKNIFNKSERSAIYQDRSIYKFNKKTKCFENIELSVNSLKKLRRNGLVSLEEIPRKSDNFFKNELGFQT